MDRNTLNYIRRVLTGPTAARYRKNTRRRYSHRGRPGTRDLQFVRPRLYCYGFPQHFSSMPASQPMQETIFARVTNAGAGTSYNTVVKLITTEQNNVTGSGKQTITLQAGETRDLTFSMSSIERVHRYQLVCFDPLHDPVMSSIPPTAIPAQGNYLKHAVNPAFPTFFQSWQPYYRDAAGNLVPVPGIAHLELQVEGGWQVQKGAPPKSILTLQPDQSYFAAGTLWPYSELRQEVNLAGLDEATSFQRFLEAGDLLAGVDAYVRTASAHVDATVGLDFLAANGDVLTSFQTPEPGSINVWHRNTATVSVPAKTARIVYKLIREQAPAVSLESAFDAYFDELYLTLTHRNVFTSSRIYTFG
jgi:hypothetical protein